MKPHQSIAVRALAGAALMFCAQIVFAQSLNAVLAADIKKNQANEASQKRIETIVAQANKLETQYRQTLKETDGLNVYVELLESQVENQNLEMQSLTGSAEKVAVIERQILPQMKKMIDALDNFIRLDLPFLQEERKNRIAGLNELLERSDVSVAQKFRSVVEAYQIESDFGRSIETYKGTVSDGGSDREVDFLRIGRIGLYWQNADATQTKAWDANSGQWIDLGADYRSAVRNGIKIANKQKAPDMLMLPVPAPEAT